MATASLFGRSRVPGFLDAGEQEDPVVGRPARRRPRTGRSAASARSRPGRGSRATPPGGRPGRRRRGSRRSPTASGGSSESAFSGSTTERVAAQRSTNVTAARRAAAMGSIAPIVCLWSRKSAVEPPTSASPGSLRICFTSPSRGTSPGTARPTRHGPPTRVGAGSPRGEDERRVDDCARTSAASTSASRGRPRRPDEKAVGGKVAADRRVDDARGELRRQDGRIDAREADGEERQGEHDEERRRGDRDRHGASHESVRQPVPAATLAAGCPLGCAPPPVQATAHSPAVPSTEEERRQDGQRDQAGERSRPAPRQCPSSGGTPSGRWPASRLLRRSSPS